MALSQLTIIGAGLIGASIALATRQKSPATRIVAIDQEPEKKWRDEEGVDQKIFDEWISADNRKDVEECLRASSLTVLCVPVSGIISLLPSILEATVAPVTDCGSTKDAICQSVQNHPDRGRFVAGHPMAGHPDGGLENARPDLFEGKKWILCPADSQREALALVTEWVHGLGAEPLELSREHHDRSVAFTSHVPQIVASALSIHALQHDALKAAGPGFASATRVAGGAEAIWRDIFDTNAEAIGEALVEVGEHLQKLGKELKDHQVEGSLATLEEARRLRKADSSS